jgi:hypothetical protein
VSERRIVAGLVAVPTFDLMTLTVAHRVERWENVVVRLVSVESTGAGDVHFQGSPDAMRRLANALRLAADEVDGAEPGGDS